MNELDILKELDKLDDDIEAGFLSELKQQTPDELHFRIMESIRLESMNGAGTIEIAAGVENSPKLVERKQRFRFNYRKYAGVASAAAILAIVFIGGGKELLNRGITPETISPNNEIVATTDNNLSNESKPKIYNDQKQMDVTFSEAADATGKTTDNNKAMLKSTQQPVAKTGKAVNGKVNTSNAPKSNPAGSNNRTAMIVPTVAPKSEGSVNQKDNNSNTTSEFTIIPSKKDGIVAAKGSTTTTTTDGKATETTPVPDNKLAMQPSTNSPDPGIEPNAPDNSASDLMVASLENMVNFDIGITDTMTDIIKFIDGKGTPLADKIYKLSTTDYTNLSQLLTKAGINPVKVNELEADAQSVVIKIIYK